MDIVLAKLIEGSATLTFRETFENKGLKKLYQGLTNNWDLKFDEWDLKPNSLVLIGYDKDLDFNLDDWGEFYEQKNKNDSVSVYSASIEVMVSYLGSATHQIKTAYGILMVPTIKPLITYIPLPFQKQEFILAISIEKEVIIPTELVSLICIPQNSDLGSKNFYGRITLPISMYTGRGEGGLEYFMALENLHFAVGTQNQYLQDNNNQSKERSTMRENIIRTKKFLKKYGKLLP